MRILAGSFDIRHCCASNSGVYLLWWMSWVKAADGALTEVLTEAEEEVVKAGTAGEDRSSRVVGARGAGVDRSVGGGGGGAGSASGRRARASVRSRA